MAYRVSTGEGISTDAYFGVDGNTLVFYGPDYEAGLVLILQRLRAAGHRLQRAWLESGRVQAMPMADRLVLDHTAVNASPPEQVSRMASRMQAILQKMPPELRKGRPKLPVGLEFGPAIQEAESIRILGAVPSKRDFRSVLRLPASELRKVTPQHLSVAVQRLRQGYVDHGFGRSTDYDLVLPDGTRLAPKAVFGVAAEDALGYPVAPRHFVGGLGSPCFDILESAEYRIVPKHAETLDPESSAADSEWAEGSQSLRRHLRRERAPGLSKKKKAEFRRKHGRLFCERCLQDPVEHYRTPDAEACIEVHHAAVQVSEMQRGHKTQLEHLQCLCANCHRLVHREMRAKKERVKRRET